MQNGAQDFKTSEKIGGRRNCAHYTKSKYTGEAVEDTMISKSDDKSAILKYAKKYKLTRVVPFGSSGERTDANDRDIGAIGLAPELFFDFCWGLYRYLSKTLDVIDLSKDCLFNKLIKRDGVVLYG
ncbi:MAG: hypothetical protein C5S49_07950 [Candidatus Methanogaster sp.]|nr:MAG: hypothetical protein C5S49_07950 [ANME-2 cluster archaeon]